MQLQKEVKYNPKQPCYNFKKVCSLQEGHYEKSEIQGGSQEMAVMVG